MTEPETTDAPGPYLDRRRILGGAAAVGLAAPLLAACGGGGNASEPQGPQPGGSPGEDLVATSDVPVGSGVILADQKVVVTQPVKGDFRAFSAVCTHQGCIVNQIADGVIQCPCHGSRYSVKDGSVVRGPAPNPLPSVKVKVKSGEIVRA